MDSNFWGETGCSLAQPEGCEDFCRFGNKSKTGLEDISTGTQSDCDLTTCSSSEDEDNGRSQRTKKIKLEDYIDRDNWDQLVHSILNQETKKTKLAQTSTKTLLPLSPFGNKMAHTSSKCLASARQRQTAHASSKCLSPRRSPRKSLSSPRHIQTAHTSSKCLSPRRSPRKSLSSPRHIQTGDLSDLFQQLQDLEPEEDTKVDEDISISTKESIATRLQKLESAVLNLEQNMERRMKSLLFQMAKQTNALENFTVNQVTEEESHAVIRKCCDLNELHELEENLQKTVYVTAMKKMLRCVGGPTFRHGIFRMLKKVISAPVGALFNMTGEKTTKRSFKNTTLYPIIVSCAAQYKDYSEREADKAMGCWFQQCASTVRKTARINGHPAEANV